MHLVGQWPGPACGPAASSFTGLARRVRPGFTPAGGRAKLRCRSSTTQAQRPGVDTNPAPMRAVADLPPVRLASFRRMPAQSADAGAAGRAGWCAPPRPARAAPVPAVSLVASAAPGRDGNSSLDQAAQGLGLGAGARAQVKPTREPGTSARGRRRCRTDQSKHRSGGELQAQGSATALAPALSSSVVLRRSSTSGFVAGG